MIPDKIYVRIEEMGDVWTLDATTLENGGQEYIRKDYLLEWAKEEIERKKSELPNLLAEGLIKAYIKVVNKLSEL